MDIEELLNNKKLQMNQIFEELKNNLQDLGFKLLETDTNGKNTDYEYPSWADFRLCKNNEEYNVSWKEPVDYCHTLSYAHGKDKFETGFYSIKDLPEAIQKIKSKLKQGQTIMENITVKLNKSINEALDIKEEPINLKEITKETLATLIPEFQELEIEFYGRIEEEIGGTIDYVYGGLKDTHMTNEDAQGFISLEHPTWKPDETEDSNKIWQMACSWSTINFDIDEHQKVETLEDVYDFILDIKSRFDEFELQKIYK